MAIIKETITLENGKEYEHIYSDSNRYVVYDGELYENLYHFETSDREYTEGDIIETEEMRNDYIKAYKMLMGVEE